MLRPNNHHKFAERDKDQMPKLLERSYSDRYGTRDCSSEAGNDDHVGVTKKLEISNQKFQELQKELNKCYLQVRDCNERLKGSEQELRISLSMPNSHVSS